MGLPRHAAEVSDRAHYYIKKGMVSEAVKELEALEPSIKSAVGSVVVGGGPYLEAVHGAGSETRKQPHNSWAGQLLLRGEMRARQAEAVLGVIQMHWQQHLGVHCGWLGSGCRVKHARVSGDLKGMARQIVPQWGWQIKKCSHVPSMPFSQSLTNGFDY